jgi:hypothetical protein
MLWQGDNTMGYAREFNHMFYNVPEFLLQNIDWEDVSWHNDVCPRFEDKEHRLAIWVDNMEPELREYEDWKQYTVVELILQSDGTTQLADDIIFATEDAKKLERWLWLRCAKDALEGASSAFCSMDEPLEELQDSIATLIAQTEEAINALS